MEIDKKQAGTIFIAFIFIVSGISFALNWQPTTQNTEENPNVLKQPISDQQRTVFIDNDVTILTLFYLEEDADSLGARESVEKLNDDMGEKLLIEEINVETYRSFSAEYSVKMVPTILIRGKENVMAPVRLEGRQEYPELKESVCGTYEEQPTVCG